MRGLAVSIVVASLLSLLFPARIVLADSEPAISGLVANPDIINSSTGNAVIEYNLSAITSGNVLLEIYDSGNNLTRSINGGTQSSGLHNIVWDGSGDDGLPVLEGTYSANVSVSIGSGDTYKLVRRWGGSGPNPGQFDYPPDVAVDSGGNIYVAEYNNKRVQKFDSNGTLITTWEVPGNPHGIAIDSNDNVYVADYSSQRVRKFDSNGAPITTWAVPGRPHGIAVDLNGNVYVPDFTNNQIHKYDSSGNVTAQWTSLYPFSVAVDSSGYVYVTQIGNKHRIQKWDSTGKFITSWGSEGSENGQFKEPRGVAVDSYGNVYVGDSGNDRIQKFDSNGNFITQWGSEGVGDGQFQFPNGVAITASNNVYVADTGNNRIQEFAPPSVVISASTSITVDNTPPSLNVSVNPSAFWPPNHKMVEVTTSVTVSDNYDPSPIVVLSSIVSNEPDDTYIQDADIGTEDYTFRLRAEMAVNDDDRVYIITYTATDTAGNSASANTTVTVPHDQGKKSEKKLHDQHRAVTDEGTSL